MDYKRPPKSILRRRQTLSSDLEALLDGLAVIALSYFSTVYYVGNFRLVDLLVLLSLLAAMTVTYDAVGLYRRHGQLTAKILRLTRAWTLSFGTIVLLSYITGVLGYFSRVHIGVFFFIGFLIQALLHFCFDLFRHRQQRYRMKRAALIIGGGWLADYLAEQINANPWLSEKVIGRLRVTSEHQDNEENHVSKLPTLGLIEDIDRILVADKIKTVYIITGLGASVILDKLHFILLDRSINIHWIPNIFSLTLINYNVKELAGIPLITLSESPLSGRALLIKNIEDKLLALLALLLATPIMIAAAIAVRLDSPGPIFFLQKRTGWDGKEFSIWKFRTMYVHIPEEGVVKQATKSDPRVTRVGRLLRRTSIDELPQLFNVIWGNMSLVGPRPHAVQHNDLYSRKIDAYLSRHRIKPGITGLAQVRGFRGETEDLRLMAERVKNDIEYINNWSLLLDLSILSRTAFSLVSSRAY